LAVVIFQIPATRWPWSRLNH